MKKAGIVLMAFLCFGGITLAQVDQKAKSVLDKLSAKTKTYKTVKASFTYTLENKADDIKEVQEGSLTTKGEKYHLLIGGQEVISDGKTIWTHLVDAGEVQITNVPTDEEKEEQDYISPTNIFTMYEEGFKYKFVAEETVSGSVWQKINLYPTKPDEKSYHTIKLYINKDKNQIVKISIMGKDGTSYTYAIDKFEVNKEIADSKFVFNKSAYPDLDYIDMR